MLSGQRPFDEARMIDDDPAEASPAVTAGAPAAEAVPERAQQRVGERVHQGAVALTQCP